MDKVTSRRKSRKKAKCSKMPSLRFKIEHAEVGANVGSKPSRPKLQDRLASALRRSAEPLCVIGSVCLCVGILLIVTTSSGPALHATEVETRPPPAPPPPPKPPVSPPRPAAPAASHLVSASTCLVRTAGVLLTAVGNGYCQDGGVGSTSHECRLGADFPDCPARYEWLPLPPPPVPNPPQTWVAVPVVFEVLAR